MPKRIPFILLLIAISPVLEAREPDIPLTNDLFDGQQPVENEKTGRSTWFGIGYESRQEHADRANFEDNAMRESVFSDSGRSFSFPERAGVMSPGAGGSPEGGSAGRSGGGKR